MGWGNWPVTRANCERAAARGVRGFARRAPHLHRERALPCSGRGVEIFAYHEARAFLFGDFQQPARQVDRIAGRGDVLVLSRPEPRDHRRTIVTGSPRAQPARDRRKSLEPGGERLVQVHGRAQRLRGIGRRSGDGQRVRALATAAPSRGSRPRAPKERPTRGRTASFVPAPGGPRRWSRALGARP